ncbi:MAG TPA: hypothetical protein VKT27_08495 [Candidatus Binataceae bacterium]|nr:hypothetical protein [Candidatus Binataceae bacterium]
MSYRLFVIARALHVLSLVVWIGGLGMVTTVILPALRRLDSSAQQAWLFDRVERRFRPQAQVAWAIVGASGLYMLAWLRAWARLIDIRYWWMDAMIALWLAFGAVLFVAEPLILGPRLRDGMNAEVLRRFQILHWVLLIVSLSVIGVVIAGIYGVL